MASYRTIQGNPVRPDIGPYIAIIVNDAHAHVNSIYRGADAEWLLHSHGKASQRELYQGWLAHRPGFLPANQPGYSTHELKSDGVAYPGVRRGGNLPWWGQGFDVDDSDVRRCKEVAARYGWHLWQPYPSGSEYHHLNFVRQPTRPRFGTKLWHRFWRIKLTLPRK